MRIAVVLTDLDGTLLEPNGSLRPDARAAVAALVTAGAAVCPVTSKTPRELEAILDDTGLRFPSGFENGAGVRHPDGALEFSGAAVPIAELREAFGRLRETTGIAMRSIEELGDGELSAMTALTGEALAAARERRATLPIVVDARHDPRINRALLAVPRLRAVRGNRFLHLQGLHDKADVVPGILAVVATAGLVVACGDAPNDIGLLASAVVRVIIPGRRGPHAALTRRFPDAVVAPFSHGRGWAAVIAALLASPDGASLVASTNERPVHGSAPGRKRREIVNDG